MTVRYRRLAPPAFLAVLAALACGEPPAQVAVGATLPAFELAARDGSAVTERSLAGAPAVLSFWATWCQPCLRDIPELNRLSAEDGIRVVAVALDEGGWSVVDPFLADHSFAATVVLGDQAFFQRFGGFAIPYTLVVDGSQVVRAVFRGAVTRDEVLAALAR